MKKNKKKKQNSLYIVLPKNPTLQDLKILSINKNNIAPTKKEAWNKILYQASQSKKIISKTFEAVKIDSYIWDMLVSATYPNIASKNEKIKLIS